MTTRRAGEIILAADLSGSGVFSVVGVMHQPTLALNAAIGDLRLEKEYPELRPLLIHMVATKIAGRCAVENRELESTLAEWLSARLATEWNITIPAVGTLRGLFLIARLERVEQTAFFDLVLQLAGRPSLDALQAEEAKAE